MTLGLTVVTHTDSKSRKDISRCIESVNAALIENSNHLIIDIGKVNLPDFINKRYDAMSLNDIIIFVDDDDYVTPESLRVCVDALRETGAGIAFTQETSVRQDGTFSSIRKKPRTNAAICTSPTVIHHMTAYRTKYVTDRALTLSTQVECGIEWIMKADALARAGSVHIPLMCYYWVQHSEQYSRLPSIVSSYRQKIAHVSAELNTWGIGDTAIPDWHS